MEGKSLKVKKIFKKCFISLGLKNVKLGMGVYKVLYPVHGFNPKMGGGRLLDTGRLQGTLRYCRLGILTQTAKVRSTSP